MKRYITASVSFLTISLMLLLSNLILQPSAQSGRNTASSENSAVLNVIVHKNSASGETTSLNKDRLMLFDGGIQQEIEYFRADPTGSRVLVLVDSSQTLRAETPQLQKAIKAVIKELYEGDQMMIVGYNEQAEILSDFSGDVKTLNAGVGLIKHAGFPKLYDALSAVVEDAFRKQLGINKRAIILISDGYDRDSKTKYDNILSTLLSENIVIYAFQIQDRTYGAIRPRDTGPKPGDALRGLVESTGGVLFKLDKPEEVAVNAKALIDELRENWYTLSYVPKGVNPINTRRLLITTSDDKLSLRTKKLHPGQLVR